MANSADWPRPVGPVQYGPGVGSGVGASVETHVEISAAGKAAGLAVQLLGPLAVSRDGVVQPLPQSRKVRALFAYLALALRAVGRSNLCELLWDVPDDPRAELRWCLSKLRRVLDEPHRQRIATSEDAITLDLSDCFVDAIEIAAAAQAGIASLAPAQLQTLSKLFVGDFLDGLEIERNPQFNTWLVAQRRRFRACHAAILEHLVRSLPHDSAEVLDVLERWLDLAPFDRPAHEILLGVLAKRGMIREGEEHLVATARSFEAEGLDWKPLRDVWRAARAEGANSPSASAKSGALKPALAEASPVSLQSNGAASAASHRASIAVTPFVDIADADGLRGGLAGGLTHDVITRLAKLRGLFVIASGTVFALGERSDADEVGRLLGVDYVASGQLRRRDGRIIVNVEVSEARTARIVWGDSFDRHLDDTLLVLDEIGDQIVSAIASEVDKAEANRAVLKAPNSLNAWEAYHRGLWHMYRFNGADNDQAQRFFKMSLRLDPTFARPHAGLSFTHFQNAFLLRPAERAKEIGRALDAAGKSLTADDRDPASHCAMGRALWLGGRHDQSLAELETAVALSPNFAVGHYTLAFVHAQSGDPHAAIGSADHSRNLSPFDPLLFAMLASRAIAHFRLGEFEDAASWAVKAAARPNAHNHALAVAAQCLGMAGRVGEAQAFLNTIRAAAPNYHFDDFIAAFRFTPDAVARFKKSAKRIGFN